MKHCINPSSLLWLVCFLFLGTVVGCSQSPTKKGEDQNAAQYRKFDAEAIKIEQFDEDDFGPNPYYAQPLQVSGEVKSAFKKILKKIKADKLEEVEPELKDFIDNNPSLSGAAYNMALLQYRLGEMTLAKEYAEKALLQNPNQLDARNLLGVLSRESGDFNQAESLWLDNLNRWGGYAASYRNLAILYDLYLGKPEKAIWFYKQYHHLAPKKDKMVSVWIKTIDRDIALANKEKALAKAKENSNNEIQQQADSSESTVQ